MSMFESFENLKKEDDILIGVNFTIAEYSSDTLLERIRDGSMNDRMIKNEIKYGSYFNYDKFIDPNTRNTFREIWLEKRFLKCVLELISEDKYFRESIIKRSIVFINMITYEYYGSENKDSEIAGMLLDICRVIDQKWIIPLSTIMHPSSAPFVPLARYSSFSSSEYMMRFNTLLCNMGYDFSTNDIIYIYSLFFSEGFSDIFSVVMTQHLLFETEQQNKINNNISLALLYILESMPTSEMILVLRQYNSHFLLYENVNVRCSLQSLPEEFQRISVAIHMLATENIYIP